MTEPSARAVGQAFEAAVDVAGAFGMFIRRRVRSRARAEPHKESAVRVLLLSAMCVSALIAPQARADGLVITDPTFFDAIPHTLIDFESLPDGTPVDLEEGSRKGMNGDEFNTEGLLIFGDPNFVNFTSDDLETIQATYATPDNSLAMLPVFPGDPVGFNLFPRVRSFGIFIMMDVSTPTLRPAFHISRDETVIQSIVFEGDLVQGRVGDIEFGFVGFYDEEPFGAVLMENFTRPAFDDLRFSAFPAPGAGATFAITALGLGLRRRR